jgi:hypothetical protein
MIILFNHDILTIVPDTIKNTGTIQMARIVPKSLGTIDLYDNINKNRFWDSKKARIVPEVFSSS